MKTTIMNEVKTTILNREVKEIIIDEHNSIMVYGRGSMSDERPYFNINISGYEGKGIAVEDIKDLEEALNWMEANKEEVKAQIEEFRKTAKEQGRVEFGMNFDLRGIGGTSVKVGEAMFYDVFEMDELHKAMFN